MKAQEVIDGNILLAKFEVPNWELLKDSDYEGGISTENLFKAVSLCSNEYENLKYHISWSWLMPVWRQVINEIGLFMSTHEDVNVAKLWLIKSKEIETDIITVNIEGAFNKIVNLIKFKIKLCQTEK